MRTLYHTYLGDTRLQNSPYFCVFKYARGFKQKVWNEPVGRVRLARLERVRLLRHALPIPLLIALFTVTVANEAGVDLVLIQSFLLYYAKLVLVMLTSIF